MFWANILLFFRSTRLCVTACGIMHPQIVGALYHKLLQTV